MKRASFLMCGLIVAGLTIAGIVTAGSPALASQVNCLTTPAACGFGTSVAGPMTFSLSTSDWTANGYSQAYDNSGTYSYVYDMTSFNVKPGANSKIALSQITTATNGGYDLFNSSLNWGLMTAQTSPTANQSPTFTFGSSSFQVQGTNLVPNGDSYGFYAQSYLAPGGGTISAQNGGLSNAGGSIDPSPEPSALALFSPGMLGLGLVALRRRRLIP
jgi:hypothetical protein